MSELDKLIEQLGAFAKTSPLGAAAVAAAKPGDGIAQGAAVLAASEAAKPADDIAQGQGKKPRNRADLVELAKKHRRRLDTLYTMGSTNDPWMADQDYRSKHAYWIADLFRRIELPRQVHDRQINYKLVSQEKPILQVDGTHYLNDADCYNRLCDAIKDARYLSLIPARMIIDRRNPEPTINFDSDDDVGAEIEINHGRVVRFPFGGITSRRGFPYRVLS